MYVCSVDFFSFIKDKINVGQVDFDTKVKETAQLTANLCKIQKEKGTKFHLFVTFGF